MSRLAIRSALIVLAVAILSPIAHAQTDPTELARGLRDNGMADLALEYLEEISKKSPTPEVLALLPLEKARARLELASDESEEGKRDALITQARGELNTFLTANANHPRRAEGAIALARLISVQAKGIVSRAQRIDEPEQRKTELARARPVFVDAADRFKVAAAAYEKLADDPALSPTQKKAVITDVYQAELDRGRNLFALAGTYGSDATANETIARGKSIDDAKAIFEGLMKKDDKHPLCWVARAWVGECERAKDNPRDAENLFNLIGREALKNRAAQAGAKQARFFLMRTEYDNAFSANTAPAYKKAQTVIEDWLKDRTGSTGRTTPEQYAARFYLGVTKFQQARPGIKEAKDPKEAPVVSDTVKPLLRSAEKDFRILTATENDYTSRAAERQTQIMRLLIGNADKDPAKINNFDEALMTAKVQLYNLVQDKGEDRAKKAARVAAMYERVQQVPHAADEARDAIDAQVTLIYVYLLANRPHEAAILGEYLAKTARAAGPAGRSGLYAIQAYLATAAKTGADDTESKKIDFARAAAVAEYLDQKYPTDPNTDLARLQIGQTLLRNGKSNDAFWMLAKVTPASSRLMSARLMQGGAAFDLLRPQAAGAAPTEKPLTPTEKGNIYRRVIADLTAVPDLPASAPSEEANLAVLVELQIAELHLFNGAASYTTAERSADRALAEAMKFTNLEANEKQELILKCRFAKMRAIYAQAVPLFRENKFPQAMAKIAPILGDLAKDGPANKPGLPEEVAQVAKRVDDFRRDQIIVLALQARIGEGAVDKAGELFDLLKKLGGSADTIAQALGQLAQAVKPQVEQLRNDNKPDEANKLIAGVGELLGKVASDPALTQPSLFNLGRAMKDIGSYDKAVEMLTKIKDPGAALLAKPIAQLTEQERLPVLLYRGAQLELARSYRLSKKFDEADKLLKTAMGTKEAKSWALTAPDFRREAAYLLEDRAEATADPKAAVLIWKEALGKWGEMAGEYLGVMRKPIPKDEKAKAELERLKAQVKPLYHDIFYESTRCTCRANSHLLKSNPTELTKKFEASAKSMVSLENANPDMSGDVKAKFGELLIKYDELKKKYVEQQGKMFLPAPAATAAGAQ